MGLPRSAAVEGAAAFLPLLGHRITLASVPTDGTVRIDLDDGSMIEVLDSSEDYESYKVTLGDRLLVAGFRPHPQSHPLITHPGSSNVAVSPPVACSQKRYATLALLTGRQRRLGS